MGEEGREVINQKIKEVQTYFIEKILNRYFSIEAINRYADARENKGNGYLISLLIDEDKSFSFFSSSRKKTNHTTQKFYSLGKSDTEA